MYSLVMWSCCWTPGQDKGALEPGLQSPAPVHTDERRLGKEDSRLHKQNNEAALLFPKR